MTLFVILSSCSLEQEERITMGDQERTEEFVRILTERNIPHTVDEYGWVSYPTSHKADASRAALDADSNLDTETQGVRVKIELTAFLKERLDTEKIQYVYFIVDDTSVFHWDGQDNPHAMRIVHEVIYDHGI